jgi:hypothetical protein
VPNLNTPTGTSIDVITKAFKELKLEIHFTHIASGQEVKFMGALNNWQDNYTSSWNEEDVYGRMDPIATFQGTKRQITIGWSVLSDSDNVGIANLRDISKFINFLYPQYSGHAVGGLTASSISSAPLLRLKFMNLVTNTETGEGLVGYINGGVSVTPNMESGFLIPESGQMIPKTIDMEITFSVLHSHDLGFNESGQSLTNGEFPYAIPDTFDSDTEVARGSAPKAKKKPTKGITAKGVPNDPGTGPTRGAIAGNANDAASTALESIPGGDKVPPSIVAGQTKRMLGGGSGGSTW